MAQDIDPANSLLVTDVEILQTFKLENVLQTLLDDENISHQSPVELMYNWAVSRDNDSEFNNLPIYDPTSTYQDPGSIFERYLLAPNKPKRNLDYYQAIAIVNRLDLANEDLGHCGEYRIVFSGVNTIYNPISGRFNGASGDDKNLVIFEARLPNPTPELGLEACLPVAEFWAELSTINDVQDRAKRLQQFYFTGIENFAPVINVDHYRGSDKNSGQIRLNAITGASGNVWKFMEFATTTEQNCNDDCQLSFQQTTVKDSPYRFLTQDFSDNDLYADQAKKFQDAVITALNTKGQGLLANTISTLSYELDDSANVGSNVVISSMTNGLVDLGNNFRQRIQQRLDEVGSDLSTDQIAMRAQALSCNGCHGADDFHDLGGELSNFTNEGDSEFLSLKVVNGRYEVKRSMREHFLPQRKAFMQTFLNFADLNGDDVELIAGQTSTRIEAEAFNFQSGFQTGFQTAPSANSNGYLGWSDNNDFASYTLPANTTSTATQQYKITYRVASPYTGSKLTLSENNGANELVQLTVDNTGGWDTWTLQSQVVNLASDVSEITIQATTGGWNLDWFEIEALTQTPGQGADNTTDIAQSSFSLKIEAESQIFNSGVETENTSDVNGGQNVGWIDNNDWFNFAATTIPSSGNYLISYRVASPLGGTLRLEQTGGDVHYGEVTVPNTGDWQNWTTIEHVVYLEAGEQLFSIAAPVGGWNINWFSITQIN